MCSRLLVIIATLVTVVAATGAEAGCRVYEHQELDSDNYDLSTYTVFLDGDEDTGVAMSGEAVDYAGEGWNDIVTLLEVTDDCELTLFEHAGFDGGSDTFGPGQHNLSDTWWNDRASSAHCICE